MSRPPHHFGYQESRWSAALLVRHLATRYGLTYSNRRCRQLLCELGPDNRHETRSDGRKSVRVRVRPTGACAQRQVPRQRLLDKSTALRRIGKLAVSGLPLEPFIRALFAIVGATLPLEENQTLLADPRPPHTGYVLSNPEIAAYSEQNRRLNIEGGTKTSGVRNFNSPCMLQKPIWMHQEITLPHFYRSAGYNEVLRRLDMHHCMIVMFVEGGRLVGRWPMWRSEGMPEWNREDARFMAMAAPYITHGLRTAQAANVETRSADGFVPIQSPTQGAVLLDRRGTLLGLDRVARALFAEVGVFDEQRAETAAAEGARLGLARVASVLANIFDDDGGDSNVGSVPSSRVWAHRTGIALRLRAFALSEESTSKPFVVLVERGELEAHRRQRLMLSHGLSPKEYEVLRLLAQGVSRRDIAGAMGTPRGTLKTHLTRLGEKLEAASQADLRSRARLLVG